MDQTIRDAVMNKQTLTFRYHNENRIVEPYCYGVDGKGHEAIRAFQHGGKGWRLFHLTDISNLAPGGQPFRVRPEYKRNDKVMDRIYAQV